MSRLIVPLFPISTVVKSTEREPRMREIRSSVSSRVKAMTYKIDARGFLAWYSALIGQSKD